MRATWIDGKCGEKALADNSLRTWCPGVVVSCNARALCPCQHRSLGAISLGRASMVLLVRLLPLARHILLLAWRCVYAPVKPTMPAWRHDGAFRIAVIDDPALRRAIVIFATLIVDVAELVSAITLAVAPAEESRVQILAIPPGEQLREKGLHRFLRQEVAVWALWRYEPAFASVL